MRWWQLKNQALLVRDAYEQRPKEDWKNFDLSAHAGRRQKCKMKPPHTFPCCGLLNNSIVLLGSVHKLSF